MHQPDDVSLAGFFGYARGRFDVDGMEGAISAFDVEAHRIHDRERTSERLCNRVPVIDIRLDMQKFFLFLREELMASLRVTGSDADVQTVVREAAHDTPAQEAGAAKDGDCR